MKKTLLFLAAIAIVCVFSSCEKEGVYHPKKKISKVYGQPGGSPKELIEKWTWEGKNLVKIANATNTFYRTFKYEKDRISKITWNDGEYLSFIFDGKYIKKVEYHAAAGELYETYSFKHTKDKITTITREMYEGDYLSKKDVAATLRLFLPVQTVEPVLNKKRPALAKEPYMITIELQWDGDNVKTSTEVLYDRRSYRCTQEVTYKYDKNINPYYYFVENFSSSKNNVISEEGLVTETESYMGETYTDSDTYTYEYDIIYDGKWPTEILEMYRNGSSTSRYTTYYTYED
jgi:hypothetical protein